MEGAKSCSCFATISVALVLLLLPNVAVVCHGGKTSTFIRKVEKTEDMPLHSDVFVSPSGYNAPQQVPLFPPINIVEFGCDITFCIYYFCHITGQCRIFKTSLKFTWLNIFGWSDNKPIIGGLIDSTTTIRIIYDTILDFRF